MVFKSNKKQSSFALKSAKTDEIIESMKTLTLMEASELVKQIEETFGVDASAPAGGGMMMMAGPAEAGEAAAVQTEFDLIITEVAADKRIACIKVVRTLTDLGLKEAKDAVTNLPFTLMAAKKKEDCQAAQKTLEEAGAKSEIK
jgi:large subunit ribosomal protein L7/L12